MHGGRQNINVRLPVLAGVCALFLTSLLLPLSSVSSQIRTDPTYDCSAQNLQPKADEDAAPYEAFNGAARAALQELCFEEARPFAERALELAEAQHPQYASGRFGRDPISEVFQMLAEVDRLRGDLTGAQATLEKLVARREEALETAIEDEAFKEKIGYLPITQVFSARVRLSRIHEIKGDPSAAAEILRETLDIVTGDREYPYFMKARAYNAFAEFLLRQERPREVIRLYNSAGFEPYSKLAMHHSYRTKMVRQMIAALLLDNQQEQALKWVALMQDIVVEERGLESAEARQTTERLTEALIKRGRYEDAVRFTKDVADRLFSKFEAADNLLNPMMNAQLVQSVRDQMRAGRYSEADGLLVTVMQLDRRLYGDDFVNQSRGFRYLADLAQRRDQTEFADRVLQRIQTAMEADDRVNPNSVRSAVLYRAENAIDNGDTWTGKSLIDGIKPTGRLRQSPDRALLLRARIALARNEHREAVRLAKLAERSVRYKAGEFDSRIIEAITVHAKALSAQGLHDAAAEVLIPYNDSAALRHAGRRTRRGFDLALSRAQVGSPTYRFSLTNPVRDVFDRTFERLLDRDTSDSFAIEGAARDLADLREVTQLMTDSLWFLNEVDPAKKDLRSEAAFLFMQYAGANELNLSIEIAAGRAAAARKGAEFARLAERREALNDEWLALYATMFETINDLSDENELARMGAVTGMNRIGNERREIDKQLAEAVPEYSRSLLPDFVDLKDIPALLKPDEAVLLIASGVQGTHSFAVSRDTSQWHFAEIDDAALSRRVRSLQWDMGALSELEEEDPIEWVDRPLNHFDGESAYALYRDIVAPVEGALKNKKRVFVVSTGTLATLPLSILLTDPMRAEEDAAKRLRRAKWLSDRYQFELLPALTSLREARASAGQNNLTEFFGIGHPKLKPLTPKQKEVLAQLMAGRGTGALTSKRQPAIVFTAQRGQQRLADVDDLKKMASLPGTLVELRRMADSFDMPEDGLLIQELATEENFKGAEFSSFDVVSIATHGLLASEAGALLQPGLVFTPPPTATPDDDGYLTPQEIAQMRIAVELVILSACNTAGGGGNSGGEGLTGLARAFFFAGSKSLFVSHWPVLDAVAPILTVEAVDVKRADPTASYASSLGAAMKKVRAIDTYDETQLPWSHPRAWAPFSVISNGPF